MHWEHLSAAVPPLIAAMLRWTAEERLTGGNDGHIEHAADRQKKTTGEHREAQIRETPSLSGHCSLLALTHAGELLLPVCACVCVCMV